MLSRSWDLVDPDNAEDIAVKVKNRNILQKRIKLSTYPLSCELRFFT